MLAWLDQYPEQGHYSDHGIQTTVIAIQQYRAAIGHFASCLSMSNKSLSFNISTTFCFPNLLQRPRPTLLLIVYLLLMAGDIHSNPGPGPNSPSDKSFNIIQVNCRSISSAGHNDAYCCTKIDEIEHLTQRLKLDAVCLTETWLDATISSNDLSIPGFTLHRRDRNRHGGGVGIYIRDSISSTRRFDFEIGDAESLWLDCKISTKRCLLAVYYRPQHQLANTVSKFIENLQEAITLGMSTNPDSLMILGDFNDKCTEWESDHRER